QSDERREGESEEGHGVRSRASARSALGPGADAARLGAERLELGGGDVLVGRGSHGRGVSPQARLAGTARSIFLGLGRWRFAMGWMNSLRLLPARRGLCRFSSAMVVTVRPL